MKKLILAAAFVTGLSALSMAAVQPPLDLRGNALYTADWVGTVPCVIFSTNAVECTTGRGAVYGVVIGSPTALASEFLVLRDSNTANTTSSSFTVVTAQSNGVAQSTVGATVIQTFPRPIQFLNGLSANMPLPGPGVGEVWTILYRPLKATE